MLYTGRFLGEGQDFPVDRCFISVLSFVITMTVFGWASGCIFAILRAFTKYFVDIVVDGKVSAAPPVLKL